MNILNAIDTIAATPSKNKKVELLRGYLDDPTFARTMDIVFNPFHSPLNVKQTPTVREHKGVISLDQFYDELPRFQSRELSGNAAQDRLTWLFTYMSMSDAEVARRVIKKDLRAGFSESSINSAKEGTIPIYPCMKAESQSDAALAKICYPAWAQIKADGMRGNMFFTDGVVTCRSRNGKLMDLLGVFDYLIPMCPANKDYVADGEFVLILPNGKKMDRKKGNGILNKSISGNISLEEVAMIQFVVWDYIPLAEFMRLKKRVKKGEKVVPYIDRFAMASKFTSLATEIQPADAPNTRIELSECVEVRNLDEATAYYNEVALRGEEGIILKNIDHPYENTRSANMVKFKAVRDCDLEVIGFNFGKDGTKLQGKLGSLVVASRDRGVITSVSGMSDALREEIWDSENSAIKAEWMGAIICVEYNERSRGHGKAVADALDHPRFIERRLDKDTADNSEDIL